MARATSDGQKDFCDIICPTNRRPFGFNWEGIGRKDALEVLEHAQGKANYDPARIMLTGHSMGGHGAWHLGSHYPNLFAAIAPCAGWISFDTYAGGANYNLNDPVQKLLARGNNPSNPLLLKDNFRPYQSVFIHHGGADETVPVTEARRMRDELASIAKVTYSEVPGGGHWFDNDPAPGADSVDWKPFFDVFRTARRKDPVAARKIDFRTMDVDINRDFGIGEVLAQEVPFELSRVHADLQESGWTISTKNVARWRAHRTGQLVVDGEPMSVKWGTVYSKVGKSWKPEGSEYPTLHGMTAAYSNNVVWAGPWKSPNAGDAGLWQLARYQLEQLWYRANATPALVDIDTARKTRSNYWSFWLTDAKEDRVSITSHSADVSNTGRMEVALTGYSKLGVRLLDRFPLLSPGIPYPDWFATDIGMIQGSAKHTQVGYFDPSQAKFESFFSSDNFPK